MDAEKAWSNIKSAVAQLPYNLHRPVLDRFQMTIRKRMVKKKYGPFRIPEYEEILIKEKKTTLLYARCIVMGKLPKKMHRQMLAWAICEPNDSLIKEYFDVCEGKKSYSRPIWMM